MKNNNPNKILTLVFTTGLMLLSAMSMATNTINFSMGNCSSTANTITFDLFVTNNSAGGDPALGLEGWSAGINFSTTIKNGSSSFSIAMNANSNDANINNIYTGTSAIGVNLTVNQIQLQYANTNVNCTGTGGNIPYSLPIGTPIKLGTFVFTNNSANWTTSSNPSLTFNTLTTVPNRNTGGTVCVAPSTNANFNTAATRTVSAGCALTLNSCVAPVIAACPSDITQCDNHVATFSTPTATGTSPSVACVPASGSTFATGTTLVTCTATNGCGNSACSFNVTINTTPVIGACPSPITQCDNHIATFSTPTSTATPAASVSCSPASGSTFATGTTLVTCTATNSCGSDACSFNITINTTPVIGACPSPITQCDNHIATFSTPTSTATPAASVSCSPASGSAFATGTTLVTCTATNSCGSDACSFNITINTTPVIGACPSPITQCDNHIATFSAPTSTATPAASVSCSPASGSTFTTGTTLVTCTATNSCGSDACSFNVTINTTPVIGSCPAAISQCNNPVATFSTPTATGSPAATVTCLPASGSTFATGTTLVTCTANNSCGSSSCSFNVAINVTPTANAGADQVICYTGTAQLAGSVGGGATSSHWHSNGDGSFNDSTIVNAIYSPGPSDIINGIVSLFLIAEPASPCTFASDFMVLTVLTAPPAPPAIPSGPSTACTGNIFNYSIPQVPNCTYTWSSLMPTYASITGAGTSASINFFGTLPAANSSYPFSVMATNACGNNTRSFSIRNKVSVPIFSNGLPSVVCQNSNGVVFSVTPVSGASSYVWSITGSGASIVGPNNGTSISVDFTTYTSVTISVAAVNACATTAPRTMTVSSVPAQPGGMSGPVYVCPGGTYSYSVPAVTGANSYSWTAPAGASISGNTNPVNITFGSTIPSGSQICVTAVGTCANSSALRCKGIGNGKPNTPGNISGPTVGQCGGLGVSYSISPVNTPVQATSYTWTVNNGAAIPGPNNLSIASVNFPSSFTSVTVSVTANNSCGSSAPRTLAVTGPPNTPTSISGTATPCSTSVVQYCALGSTSATSFIWTIPAGSTILGSATGSCILVQWGSNGGSITCRGTNACGTSGTKVLAISVPCREGEVINSMSGPNAQVYPNPASGNAVVKFTSLSASKYYLTLTDVVGQTVLSQNGMSHEGINMVDINLWAVAKGVYLLSIESGENTQQIRLVVE